MTVNVNVNATWRTSNIQFHMVYGMPQTISALTEYVLSEASEPILRKQTPPMQKIVEGPQSYGTLPSDGIYRDIPTVIDETVVVDGTEMSLKTVMDALYLFFERWGAEDKAPKPEPTPMDGRK